MWQRVAMGLVLIAMLMSSTLLSAQGEPETDSDASEYSYMFAQTADRGTLTEQPDGSFLLVLENIGPTLWFTERPGRFSGHITTERYINVWTEGNDSMTIDPPNAALQLGDISYVFELTNPVYDVETATLRYTASVLPDGDTIALTVGEQRPPEALTFDMPSLFIDQVTLQDMANAMDKLMMSLC